MANNPADDRYNPPGIGQNDFDSVRFDEIEEEDLFWLNQRNDDSNPPFRKMNDKQGHNTRDGIVHNFTYNQVVFQRS